MRADGAPSPALKITQRSVHRLTTPFSSIIKDQLRKDAMSSSPSLDLEGPGPA